MILKIVSVRMKMFRDIFIKSFNVVFIDDQNQRKVFSLKFMLKKNEVNIMHQKDTI